MNDENRNHNKKIKNYQINFTIICFINTFYLIKQNSKKEILTFMIIPIYILFVQSSIYIIFYLLIKNLSKNKKEKKKITEKKKDKNFCEKMKEKNIDKILNGFFIVYHLINFFMMNLLYIIYRNISDLWDFWNLIYLLYGYCLFIFLVFFFGIEKMKNEIFGKKEKY